MDKTNDGLDNNNTTNKTTDKITDKTDGAPRQNKNRGPASTCKYTHDFINGLL